MNPKDCFGCKSPIIKKEFMRCVGCKNRYDLQCADLSPKRYKKLSAEQRRNWACSECQSKMPKQGSGITAVHIPAPSTSLQPPRPVEESDIDDLLSDSSSTTLRRKRGRSPEYVTEDSLRDIWKNEMRKEMETMLETTLKRTVTNQLQTQFTGFQESITYVSTQYDDLLKEMSDLKKLLATTSSDLKSLKEENKNLKESLSTYETRVKVLEEESLKQQQWVRMQNIEITGIPEKNGELTPDLVRLVAKHIGVVIQPSDIEFAHRVQPRRAASAARARPIVARLKERTVKDQIVAAARKRRNLTAREMGVGSETDKVFINEHLTRDSKMLLNSCKQKAKESNYRFIWTKNCRIYARKNEDSPPIPINSPSDLMKLV